MTKIIGLDLSLARTGFCVLGENGPYAPGHIITKPVMPLHERIAAINLHVLRMADAGCHVFIEGYSFGSFGGQLRDRTELAGVIKHNLWLSHIPYSIVAPTTLKKWVTGKGNAEKSLMLHMIAKKTGVECENDDAADATGLVDFGWHLLHPGSPLRTLLAYEKEILATFNQPKVKKSRKRKGE